MVPRKTEKQKTCRQATPRCMMPLKQKMERTIGKPPGTGDVIDWDGPDQEGAPPKYRSGWGKFPGAKYLGIPDEKKMESEHDKGMPGMENSMDAEEVPADDGAESEPAAGADHSGMKHDMPSPLPSDEPTPPADR